MRLSTNQLVRLAREMGTAVPAFNIPYLPMMEPTVRALQDTGSIGLIMVARLEWIKFQAGSIEAVAQTYAPLADPRHTRLHLDHVPVIDEDGIRVDFLADLARAVNCGYESVMVDGSRLSLEENILCTRQAAELAHRHGAAIEGELGAVMGHETGPMPPYEELFATGKGFTDAGEAERFVRETGVDWLSVAIGNVHGAIAAAARESKKVEARLNIDQLVRLSAAAQVPLVLHGGTGIRREYLHQAIGRGIAKINVATATRQPYERLIETSEIQARQAVYEATVRVLREELQVAGNAALLEAADKEMV